MLNRIKHLFSPKDTSQHILINAYCTVAEVPKPGFPHVLNARRDLSDPELQSHLNGFMNHLAQAGAGRMTQVRYHVIRHVQRVRQHVSLSIEAGAMDSFAAWAEAAN